LEKYLKSLAQYQAETDLRLEPTGRGSLPRAVGRNDGWASPAGQPACSAYCSARGTTRWRARRRQCAAGDLDGVTVKVPGKEERAGAHRNGGSTVRRCKRPRAAAFVGGEVAPVVVGGDDEALQLGRGEGVRDLQEFLGLAARGGVHRGVADGGGARPKSTRERGLPVAGGGGPGAGSGGGSSGTREKESERSGDGGTSRAA
jgi:hypothetical protein